MPINPKRPFWIALLLLLTACGTVPPSTPTRQVELPGRVYRDPVETATPAPSKTSAPTAIILPTLTPTPTQTPLPVITVAGLRMAYIIDGNLYVQDSGKEPVQLTDSGLDRSPMFSDDGERIVFYHGEAFDLYSIKADGSQEQLLTPPGLLTKLNLGYNEFTKVGNIAFLPGTHQLLFNTSEVKPWGDKAEHTSSMDVQMNWDLLLLDTETAKIKRLLAPGKGGIFQISPDGKLDVDYAVEGYIDVVGIYGQINRRHMITSQPNWNYSMRYPFWSQDSSKCIFVVPIGGSGDGTDGPRPDAIWQYSVDSNSAVEIRLNPLPLEDNYSLSPNGNWIAYTPSHNPEKNDEILPFGFYIGNLRDGSSKLVERGQYADYGMFDYFYWSPDSEHYVFLLNGSSELYLGNKQGDIALVNKATTSGRFLGWIDDNHYLYQINDVVMGEVGKDSGVIVVDSPDNYSDLTYVYMKPK